MYETILSINSKEIIIILYSTVNIIDRLLLLCIPIHNKSDVISSSNYTDIYF